MEKTFKAKAKVPSLRIMQAPNSLGINGSLQRRESGLSTAVIRHPPKSCSPASLPHGRDSGLQQCGRGMLVKITTCCLYLKTSEIRGSCWATDPIQQQPKSPSPSQPSGGGRSGSAFWPGANTVKTCDCSGRFSTLLRWMIEPPASQIQSIRQTLKCGWTK